MSSRPKCAAISRTRESLISLNSFSVCSGTTSGYLPTKAMPTGSTSAARTITSAQTKTSQTCNMPFSNTMWKARLSELEFDERELAAVLETLESEWITAGPRTEQFEKAFARFTETAEAVAVSNGTAALFLALKALGLGPGDE